MMHDNVSSSGNKYILVMSDYFTKLIEAYPAKDMETKNVVETMVERFISRMGVWMIIHSNNLDIGHIGSWKRGPIGWLS